MEEDDYRGEVFSRRKLESNWDRYKESEKQEPGNDDTPTKRGEDFQVLLETAGKTWTCLFPLTPGFDLSWSLTPGLMIFFSKDV